MPRAHVEPAFQYIPEGTNLTIRAREPGMRRPAVVSVSAKDRALRRFLQTEIGPIQSSSLGSRNKIARALGVIRHKLGSIPVSKRGRHDNALGSYLEAPHVRSRPFAVLAMVAVQSLGIPGMEVRLVKGTRHAVDMKVKRADMWLEVEFPTPGGSLRLGVDPRTGGIEPLATFYASPKRAPRYEAGPNTLLPE